MKIERFFYGMVDGKIILLKTARVNNILSDENFQFLRKLSPKDNNQWWLPTEQVVALSHVQEVKDNNGRSWVQNTTLLIPIHDYIRLTKPNEVFSKFFETVLTKPPENFEPVTLEG